MRNQRRRYDVEPGWARQAVAGPLRVGDRAFVGSVPERHSMAAYLHLSCLMDASSSTDNPSERGIGFQAVGFAVVGCASVAILQAFSESGSWAYQSFETAVVRLYWAFVVPLAALFDWGRRMFETRQEIRKAARKKAIKMAVKKAVREALEEERRRLRERIAAATWTMPAAEVERQLFGSDQP